jgi:hypothetical protein
MNMAVQPTTSRARVATRDPHAHALPSNNSIINNRITSNSNTTSQTRACAFPDRRLTLERSQCRHLKTCTMAAIMVNQTRTSGR